MGTQLGSGASQRLQSETGSPKEVLMTSVIVNTADIVLMTACDLRELVRGREQGLIERVAPVVCQQNVALDLGHVERIDAAGIAALISLYNCARNSGHTFTVSNASPRVVGILALVGLDGILLSHNAVPYSQCEPCFERPAA
jgi:anti-anti-sigma regulatory factor